jgi:methyl-accepting chemotaxis protein
MHFLDSLSVRARLFLMVGIGTAFSLILLATALISFNGFRTDIGLVSTEVENSSRALARVSAAQSAFQTQLRGLNNMLLRNFMAQEYEKAHVDFVAGQKDFWQQLDALDALNQKHGIKGRPNLVEIRTQAMELNQLYEQVLAENQPGMPKYTVMVDAALRDADLPLIKALAKANEAISLTTNEVVSNASTVAENRHGETVVQILLVGIGGSVLALLLAGYLGTHLINRLGGELEPVVEAARRIADGNLSQGIPTGKAAADSLVVAVSDMQTRLRDLISQVKHGANSTSLNAQTLRESANLVASSSSEQSDSAAIITAAIEELTTAISVMADSAGAAADASRMTRQTANESGQIIHQAIGEIGNIFNQANASASLMIDLKQHTLEISGFAQEIKQISEQTNLLSLNAAIEAARAGDAGRGFAVVADEVRKLANHTSETTHKIESLVSKLSNAAQQTADAVSATAEQAQRGTELASSAGEAIATIEAYCERSMISAREIVEVLAEQRLAAEQISQNTERMAQTIERGSQAASDSSASANEVASLAERMRQSTLQFSV